MKETFLYVLVLYRVPLHASPAFLSLLSARPDGQLFVYDNSPEPMGEASERVAYVHDPLNEGISKAYIVAAEYAKAHRVDRIVFFDQDTHLSVEFFDILEQQIANHPEIAIFAPILKCGQVTVSPCRVFLYKGIENKHPLSGVHSLRGTSLINSALCVSTEAYFKSGGYNRAIRLDFSDLYFIDELRKHYKEYYLLPVELEHALSTFVDNKEKVISRFRFYCDGARHYLNPYNFIFIATYVKLRMLKLCFRYKTVKFVKIYFRYFVCQGKL